jgi:carbamoyltransferase
MDCRAFETINVHLPKLLSVANGWILRETPFEELYIQPSAGYGGGRWERLCGAYQTILNHSRKFVLEHAYGGGAQPRRD